MLIHGLNFSEQNNFYIQDTICNYYLKSEQRREEYGGSKIPNRESKGKSY